MTKILIIKIVLRFWYRICTNNFKVSSKKSYKRGNIPNKIYSFYSEKNLKMY